MTSYFIHAEPHLSNRNNWLRASVLGANDGLVSTASLLMGVAAGGGSTQVLLLTALASMIGGALSMAAGEYISVSSQADTEKADLQKEAYELQHNADRELMELTQIYKNRGLSDELASQVAVALTKHNALEAHARDEIGLSDVHSAKPLEAALSSAAAFVCGAVLPTLAVWLLPKMAVDMLWGLGFTTLMGLVLIGVTSAKLGGANMLPAVIRIVLWGVLALLCTAVVGRLFGVAMA